MSEDTRSGVFIVRDRERIVAVWSSVWIIDRELEPEQRPAKRRVQIKRTSNGVPVIFPKIQGHGTYLDHNMLHRFQVETGLRCQSVERRVLEQMAESEHGKRWVSLTLKQRLKLLDAVVCLYAR